MTTNGDYKRRDRKEESAQDEEQDLYDEAFEKYLETRRRDEPEEELEEAQEPPAELATYDADGEDVVFLRKTVTMGDFGAQKVHRERRELSAVEEIEGRSHKFHVKRSPRREEPVLEPTMEEEVGDEEYEYQEEDEGRPSLVLPLSFALLAASTVLLGIPGSTHVPSHYASPPSLAQPDERTALSKLNYDTLPQEQDEPAPPAAELPQGVAASDASFRDDLIESLPPPVVMVPPRPQLHPPSNVRALPADPTPGAIEDVQPLDTLPSEPPSLVQPTAVVEPLKVEALPTSPPVVEKRQEIQEKKAIPEKKVQQEAPASTVVVQLTAATSSAVAEKLANSLVEEGFPAEVRHAVVNGKNFWRVVVPVGTRDEGTEVARSLKLLPFVKDQPIIRDMK